MANIKIDNQDIEIIEYKGQRVITTQTIADFHETEVRIINQKFRRNREHFELDKDYFVVTKQDAGHNPESQIVIEKLESLFTQNRMTELYLFTESGYFKFVKTINDKKAWYVYEQLINAYFIHRERIMGGAKFLARSKEHRNGLTKEWSEHGAKNYPSLTVNSYNALFQNTGIRKNNMNENQLTLLSAFEYLEAMKLQNNAQISGDKELRASTRETASGIMALIEPRSESLDK